jgi:acyl phosphate:glycerol-3-phosphate acyltransferase
MRHDGGSRPVRERGSSLRVGLAALAGYLVGTFPTADIVTRYAASRDGHKITDLRSEGTGNPGALNAAKTLGWRWGALVLAGDAIKGSLASVAGRMLAGDNGTYAAGSGAVIGHCAPMWNGFRGGKGLATSAGTSVVCFPAYMPLDVGLAAATLALSRGRAGTATYVASAVFVAASVYWWREKKGNLWGPKATVGLPLYAITSSAMIAYRFLSTPHTPSQIVQVGELAGADAIEPEAAVAS